eukprot:TRINITY_DN2027_c0_g1_i4.p2 TRINITY_DN2027_c0_g1~~TRINITY_DN2027_c0_g1_i4.p2  ORF type:complete len:101 (-),score=23.48 TRINITY_DN2027_c0_g1_i4:208-510(-)
MASAAAFVVFSESGAHWQEERRGRRAFSQHDWEDARRSREVKADEEATQRLLDRETLQAVCEAEAAKFVALTTSLASGKYAPSPSHHGVRVHASRRRSGV